jgi:hypothetical protein
MHFDCESVSCINRNCSSGQTHRPGSDLNSYVRSTDDKASRPDTLVFEAEV